MTQRSNVSLSKPIAPPPPPPGQLPALRHSCELTSQKIEATNEGAKVVARGLGKDRDVTAVNTKVEKNTASRAVAQTIIMRKDPSKGSLHSARESIKDSAAMGRVPSHLRKHIAMCN